MSQTNRLGPLVLEGRTVRLEPLRERHAAGLIEAAKHTDWTWFLTPLDSEEKVGAKIEDGLKKEAKDEEYAFAVVDRRDGRVIGSTSYLRVVSGHRRVEIGSTWYAKEFWGTTVNPECKLLLLTHAFEDWKAVRVELVTDTNNVHSQRAIAKLGATLEGKLRNYGIRPNGRPRDVCLYSIVDGEWAALKPALESRSRGPGTVN